MKKLNSDKKEREDRGKWIRSTIILEIIGKPPEYLVKTLEEIIKNIDEEKGVEVTGKKINEPILMKDSKEFYTTFAEVDLEVEDILYLSIIMFKYMPAHIEVLEPELIALTNNGWTEILSELTRRLHGYEEIARMLQLQNSKMQKKLKELLSKDNQGSPNAVASPKELLPNKKETKDKGKDKNKPIKEGKNN
jgi:hypothetical protein